MPQVDEVDGDAGAEPRGNRTNTSPTGLNVFMNYVSSNKIEAAQWCSRLFTIFCSLMFIVPIYGQGTAHSFYTRALIAHGMTSALRLHQRLPHFEFSRVYMGMLLVEDSCHNLFYSLMFATSHPVTMVLTPVFLYAVLHSSNFTKKAVNMIGSSALGPIKLLTDKIIGYQVQILRFIAMNEIVLMPFLIFAGFTGRTSLIVPFLYIRFLTFRYASRRNPYCRQLFGEMRIVTENYSQRETTPGFLRSFLTKAVMMVSRFAPPEATAS